MELHTFGVDGGYTPERRSGSSRCFTGWTLRQPRQERITSSMKRPTTMERRSYGSEDTGKWRREGWRTGDQDSGSPSINSASFRPSRPQVRVGHPPPSLIDKMASAYLKSDGDLKTVYKVMFTSKEFWAPEAFRSKIKTPFEMTISAVRHSALTPPVHQASTDGYSRWVRAFTSLNPDRLQGRS